MHNLGPQGLRVFLVDDHPVMRSGLSLLLTQSGHVVCGVAGSRAELLDRIDAAEAAVALLDLSLAQESGLDVIDDLETRGVPTLIYSMHEDGKSIELAFSRGARGYVTKREVEDILLEALAAVAAGRRYTSPEVMRSLADRILAPDGGGQAVLSHRENQILAGLGRGETTAEMSKALNISFHTVETYYGRLLRKLALPNMNELRKLAIRRRG